MTELVTSRPRAITFNVREQRERWLSPVNLHWAGIGVLALVILYMLIQMGYLYQQVKSQDKDALEAQRMTLQTAKVAARPLQGIDAKLAKADQQTAAFYNERFPVSYSEVATQLGLLKDKNHVRLTNVQYTQAPVTDISVGQLTEVKMDASLSGDYRGLVEFLNGLERDKVFFIVNGVTLTGQQSGTVNLRMKLTTYLRGLSTDEEAARASTPIAVSDDTPVPATATQGGRP